MPERGQADPPGAHGSVILAADIGGTNSRFALFLAQRDKTAVPELRLVHERWYPGREYPSFPALLRTLPSTFLPEALALAGQQAAAAGQSPSSPAQIPLLRLAVFAPAGPIEGEVCRTSNIPWEIRAADIHEILGISRVFLINDFAAQAYACLMPEKLDLAPVLAGIPQQGTPAAVVGAGTGFGKALLLKGDEQYDRVSIPSHAGGAQAGTHAGSPPFSGARVLTSEGGHVEFPFVGRDECLFAEFLQEHTGRTSLILEAVVSGSGLAHLFAFHTGQRLPPNKIGAELEKHPVVLEWFARFYGRVCRNFVLDTLALNGVYVTGGMAAHIPVLEHPAFQAEFYSSFMQERLLRQVPVWHVRNQQAGLWGAAVYGVMQG